MSNESERVPGSRGPIVLLTDFGLSDPFVGQMKGVIAGIAPGAHVLNLCHEVPPLNIMVAAMFLRGSCRYFPPGSIFIVVVDPGVGTGRKSVILKACDQYFVGPDNGCLWPMTELDESWQAVQIENPAYMLPEISATFHGRDIFAPAAAHLANGVPMSDFGSRVESLVPLAKSEIEFDEKKIRAEIVHFDHFGNAWTNIPKRFLEKIGWIEQSPRMVFNVASCKVKGLERAYMTGELNKPIALINSFDLVEIAWPGASAKDKLRLWLGVSVEVELRD